MVLSPRRIGQTKTRTENVHHRLGKVAKFDQRALWVGVDVIFRIAAHIGELGISGSQRLKIQRI